MIMLLMSVLSLLNKLVDIEMKYVNGLLRFEYKRYRHKIYGVQREYVCNCVLIYSVSKRKVDYISS